jgi:hypothetical protein
LFVGHAITDAKLYVRPNARTRWSAAALLAEYGELGLYGAAASANSPASSGP